jgi:hypothetical protein
MRWTMHVMQGKDEMCMSDNVKGRDININLRKVERGLNSDKVD